MSARGSIVVVPATKIAHLALAALTSVALLSACSPSSAPEPSEPAAPSGQPSSSAPAAAPTGASASAEPSVPVGPAADLSGVTVGGGEVPTLTVPTPWSIANTTTKVLKPSSGTQKLTKNSIVKVHYLGVNGSTGQTFDSSYASGAPLDIALEHVVPGFRLGLEGQTVGSRVLIGMPSSDGYPEGNADGTIKPGDSLLFVVDILSANFEAATGEPQPAVPGMPTVAVDAKGVPTAKFDSKATPPGSLQKATLVKGPGAAVTAQSTVQVKYRSWVWATGKPFEQAWSPQAGRLSGLIEGWKQGLVGQTAGSRVVLVVPPALAYPEGRTTAPELEPGQTLVYVIDILDVQNP